jgi:hypothetical protein
MQSLRVFEATSLSHNVLFHHGKKDAYAFLLKLFVYFNLSYNNAKP